MNSVINKKILNHLIELKRGGKIALLAVTDVVIALGCLYLSIAIHEESFWPLEVVYGLWPFILMVTFLVPIIFWWFGLYFHMVRYGGASIFIEAIKSVTLAIILTKAFSFLFFENEIRLEILASLWAYLLIGTLGVRLFAKWVIDLGARVKSKSRERVAIFGAGEAGIALLNVLEGNVGIQVVCLFDDDFRLSGRRARGFPIFHTQNIGNYVQSLEVDQIIVAIASLSHQRRTEILQNLENLGVRVRVLPIMKDLIEGKVSLSQVRDVNASDLLWRSSHKPDHNLMKKDIFSKVVMVTGGGGSIGSELCRQAMKTGAGSLVIYEQSEFALYLIEQELGKLNISLGTDVEIIPVLGDVADQNLLERTMKLYRVSTVYHAAAYKHVPMVEFNTCEGVRNNVFGTYETARAAQKTGVDKFVLISTDKAVRPTNVMGASKRLSEMILQAIQKDQPNFKTKFTMVRFGNVLDSAGSVVPLFRNQIKEGGPVTLTHKDVTRYFMTIPEASQLVLQAGAMARGGEVFLLDMGEPVKIYDLATKMISLSGFSLASEENPDGDIEIKITGMRPGEKLYEELFITENVMGTLHSSILKAEEQFIEFDELKKHLLHLKEFIVNSNANEVRNILLDIVEGYTPGIEPEKINNIDKPNLTVVN